MKKHNNNIKTNTQSTKNKHWKTNKAPGSTIIDRKKSQLNYFAFRITRCGLNSEAQRSFKVQNQNVSRGTNKNRTKLQKVRVSVHKWLK